MRSGLSLLLAMVLIQVMTLPASAIETLPFTGLLLGPTAPQQQDPTCYIPYSNPNIGSFATYLPDGELLDDLHMKEDFTGPEELCGFDIRMRNTLSTPQTAEVTIYQNNAVDDAPGAVIAGPYQVPLPVSVSSVVIHHDVTEGMIEKDVWFGVKFPAGIAYVWLSALAPTIGTSHDVFWLRDASLDKADQFGDGYSNFYVTLYTIERPVQAQTSTWGSLKARYR